MPFRRQLTLLAPVLALGLAACGSSSSGSSSAVSTGGGGSSASPAPAASSSAVVRTVSNPTLGRTVLVDAHGMTLYALSAERNGKFICTSSACLAVWHPLVASGAPTGSGVSMVKRPDGTEQVAYRGMPLYTFSQDTKPGDARGQGLKDVGTWSAVSSSGSSAGAAPSTPTSTTSTSSASSSSRGAGPYGY